MMGLTRAHNWPHGMEIVIYAACAGAVGVIDPKIALLYPLHASPPHCCCCATLTSFFPWVSRHLSRTHTQNRFPGFLTSKKQASIARPHRQHTAFTITTLRCCLTDSDTANQRDSGDTAAAGREAAYLRIPIILALNQKPCLLPAARIYLHLQRPNTQHKPRLTLGHLFTCLC